MAPALVLWHLDRLPDTSLLAAMQQGGWEHFGWGHDRHIAADTHDAINFNSEVTGNWKERVTLPRWPRPKSKAADDQPKKVSVRDLWNKLKNQEAA